jgi:hypothetical protein
LSLWRSMDAWPSCRLTQYRWCCAQRIKLPEISSKCMLCTVEPRTWSDCIMNLIRQSMQWIGEVHQSFTWNWVAALTCRTCRKPLTKLNPISVRNLIVFLLEINVKIS